MPDFRRLSSVLMFGAVLAAFLTSQAGPTFAQTPDSQLKGITVLGIEVDGIGAQAATCGVNRDAIEAAVAKALTDGGVKVTDRADTDVFLYVNVNTASPTAGLCVSRYDVSLNTYVTATLAYQTQPALLQVVLARQGGLTGGSPGTHGDAVVKAVKQYVDQFAQRIRGGDAGR